MERELTRVRCELSSPYVSDTVRDGASGKRTVQLTFVLVVGACTGGLFVRRTFRFARVAAARQPRSPVAVFPYSVFRHG